MDFLSVFIQTTKRHLLDIEQLEGAFSRQQAEAYFKQTAIERNTATFKAVREAGIKADIFGQIEASMTVPELSKKAGMITLHAECAKYAREIYEASKLQGTIKSVTHEIFTQSK